MANHRQQCKLLLRHEVGVELQFIETGGYVGLADGLQLVRAEGFAGVAGGDAAVDDGGFQVGKGRLGFAIGRKPARQAAQEGITCASGVKNGMKRVSGAGEEIGTVFAEQEAAVFTAFHDDKTWAFGLEAASGFHQIGGACEFFGFTVIDDQEVDLFQDIMQALIGDADPKVHRVGGDEVCSCALFQGLELIVWAHVGQHGDFGRRGCRGELGDPGFQHVDRHIVSGAAVHIVVVFTTPGKGGSAAAFQAVQGNAFAA